MSDSDGVESRLWHIVVEDVQILHKDVAEFWIDQETSQQSFCLSSELMAVTLPAWFLQ